MTKIKINHKEGFISSNPTRLNILDYELKEQSNHCLIKLSVLMVVFMVIFYVSTRAQDFRAGWGVIRPGEPVGNRVIADPKVAIIYWSTSEARWNEDAGPTMTRARIDAYVQALIRSAYFSQLTQYSVSTPEWIGSRISGPVCKDPRSYITDLAAGRPAVPIYGLIGDDLNALVQCVVNSHASFFSNVNVILLLLPPPVTPSQTLMIPVTLPGAMVPLIPWTFTNPATALHVMLGKVDWWNGFSTAICPLTAALLRENANITAFQALVFAITHELAEAMTNPHQPIPPPFGQDGFVNVADANIGNTVMYFNEINDLCDPTSSTRFLDGLVSDYWSQTDMACVNGFNTARNAQISGLSIFGSGRRMGIEINGSGFGTFPSDYTGVGSSSGFTLNLKVEIASTLPEPDLIEAGNQFAISPLVPVELGISEWTDTRVRINGFGPTFSNTPGMTPGDVVFISIANQNDGQFISVFDSVPLPMWIMDEPDIVPNNRLSRITKPMIVGETLPITGKLVDENNAGEGNVPISLSSTTGFLATNNLTTDDAGHVTVNFTAPQQAGRTLIECRFPAITKRSIPPVGWIVPVAPIVSGAIPSHGDKGGQTLVTIAGNGFVDGRTTVTFNGVQATLLSVTQNLLTMKAPPMPHVGPALINVAVDGIPSFNHPAFTYIIPDVPLLTFSNPGCGTSNLNAEIYNVDGVPVSKSISIKATQGLFVTSGTPFTSSSVTTDIFTGTTDNYGRLKTLLKTGTNNENNISVANMHGTQVSASSDETDTITVIAKSFCTRLKNDAKGIKVRFVLSELLLPEIVDGCFACDLPSKFQVKWQSSTPVLRGLLVTGFTNDPAIAKNVSVSVVGLKKATTILKQIPNNSKVVGLIEVNNGSAKTPFELIYAPNQGIEQYGVEKLENGKWVRMQAAGKVTRGVSVRLKGAGIYALVATGG